ncbi:MAG: hypothetical protein ABIR62_16405 [Dokdonella sp.]|uniref:hypothetical protein n=1 Tax=Dokdonella sp. TaxID=2291710 RepID=UPI00326574B3
MATVAGKRGRAAAKPSTLHMAHDAERKGPLAFMGSGRPNRRIDRFSIHQRDNARPEGKNAIFMIDAID